MLVGDNKGHPFLKGFCDMIWSLPSGEGDVWIYDDNKKEPYLKYEIKFLGDFVNRLVKDTLNMQLDKVDGIILIGNEGPTLHWDFERLNEVLNGITDHTRVYRVLDIAQLERFLRLRETKVKDGTFGLFEKRKAKVKDYPPMVEALTNIDKVTYTISQRIYEQFSSLEDMVFEAQQIKKGRLPVEKSRFCKIDKVGKVIALKAVEWVTQQWPQKEPLAKL